MAKTPHHHSVYVVELDPAVLRDTRYRRANPQHRAGFACLYVGSTGLPPGERFQNHKAGVKANRYVRDFGIGLLPEMYECFNPMPWAAAVELEHDLAVELREKGYAVWQG
jgi:hypothetical protein